MSNLLNKYVKFMRGTQAAYNALAQKDPNTLYFITDGNKGFGALYLGESVISGGDIVLTSASLKELSDVIVEATKENSFLVQNADGKWDNMAIADVAALIKTNMGELVAPAQVFQADLAEGETHDAAIVKAVNGKTLTAGDIAIVKEIIGVDEDDNSVAKAHTAYVYDGTNWTAMDGNYSARNVFFDEDFTFTKAVGTVSIPSSGSTVVDAKGKNLSEFFASLFAAENTNPTKTEPSVKTLTIGNSGSYEVGSTVNPTYTIEFDDGSYQYGPEPTGVTVSNWLITSGNGDNISIDVTSNDKQTGNLAAVTVKADTSITYTAKATYSAGVAAKTNLGNDSSVKIAASSKSKSASASIKGYRNSFYGTLADKTTELTSAVIRRLTKSDKTLKAGDTLTIDVAKDSLRTILAVPAGLKPSYVGHREGLNAPLLDDNTTKVTVAIDGATAGADTIDYDVYVWTYADPYASLEHYDVTI